MKKETFKQKFKRWYVEGLTGELIPDYKELDKRRKKDLKRLEESIKISKEKISHG